LLTAPAFAHSAIGQKLLTFVLFANNLPELTVINLQRFAIGHPTATMVTLRINGQEYQLEVPHDMPLLWVLRDIVGLTGTKFGCGVALCGACTVHLDGQAIRACITPAANAIGKNLTTIELIGETPIGRKVQQAWLDLEVVQCGYCQSGQIMSAAALLADNSNPSDADIDAAMSGNICRCGTYQRIRAAIKEAAQIS
jgi:isoquinoline 1-oxidoreductase alpha subunit